MSDEEKEVLETLRDCSGQIDSTEFTPKETKTLKELEKKRCVALRWVITAVGKEKIK